VGTEGATSEKGSSLNKKKKIYLPIYHLIHREESAIRDLRKGRNEEGEESVRKGIVSGRGEKGVFEIV